MSKTVTEEQVVGLGEINPNLKDVNLNEWLEEEEVAGEYGWVEMAKGVKLKIAPLSEAEVQDLMRVCTRPDPTNPGGGTKLDSGRFRLAVIARSLTKANPDTPVFPDTLKKKKFGTLTKLQDAVMEISGMGGNQSAEPTTYFPAG